MRGVVRAATNRPTGAGTVNGGGQKIRGESMSRQGRRYWVAAVILTAGIMGCHHNQRSECETCSDEEPHRWTDAWWEQKARLPAGARQLSIHGKEWPPYPRPTGPHQEWSHRFHHAHYWPYPYNCQDLAYIHALSDAQVGNGWMKETTLYEHHFDPETNTLNHAGRLHLKWILQTIPEQRRYVWVQANDDKAISEARMASVQQTAAELAVDGKLPPIALRITERDGRPTDEINRIRQQETDSIPVPRIPYNSSSGGNSFSAGGSSGGSSSSP